MEETALSLAILPVMHGEGASPAVMSRRITVSLHLFQDPLQAAASAAKQQQPGTGKQGFLPHHTRKCADVKLGSFAEAYRLTN